MSQETNNADICSQVNIPVIILSGEKDTVISNEMHMDLVAALPEAKQHVFPNTGHASYAEYPDLFNDHVKDFAMKVWPGDRNKTIKTSIKGVRL
jgi:pimeloyl-ACP methyl ester carboxylesterase